MTEAAVTFLLEKVEQIVIHYASLLGDAEDELEHLTEDLERLKGFLDDAGQKQQKDASSRLLEREIRFAVYKAEDTIDCCLTQAVAAKTRWYRKLGSLGKTVKLAEGVKAVRAKIAPLIERAEKERGYGAARGGGQSPRKEKPIRTIRQDNVVGFDEEEQTIINYLMEQQEELDVISIIGMPGLGKTTLAMKVFQNSQIKSKFATRIWVNVSEEYSQKEVLLQILKEFTKTNLSSLNVHDLCQEVRGHLETGKFLLVLDDVWSVDTWNAIKNVLPSKNDAGKVLITSRYRTVGVHANPRRPEPHMLSFLSEEHSWELLQLEVYGSTNGCPKELKEIGRQIAVECSGLPLAILVIGGILLDYKAGTLAEIKWKEVSKDVSSYFQKNIKTNKQYNIVEVVAQSYNRLPDNLRECFLYLGVFPEDYAIPVHTLIHLWIAEGFIKPDEQGPEKTAKDNLEDLIDRNLLMIEETTPYGKLKTCKVHDVIRQFCKSKAALEDQNLFQEIKKTGHRVFHPSVPTMPKLRRLCIYLNVLDLIEEMYRGKIKSGYLRSFLCFCKDSFTLDNKLIFAIPETLHLLRVLDSKSFKFPDYPDSLENLIHLRYITLSCDNLGSLPESVSKLKSLQTLLVYTTSPTLRIKANIWKLHQLRHLITKASIILDVQKKGKSGENNKDDEAGENLQTLSRLSPECCTMDVFNRAQNLNKLGILGNLASLLQSNLSLEELECLENLKLVHVMPSSDKQLNEKDFFFQHLPTKNFFPKNIKKLTLSAIYLDSKRMSTLGKIETLEVLKLKNNDFTGQLWYFSGGFPSLRFLLIATTNLVKWEAEPEASDDTKHFPSLSCLVLEQCTELGKIPKFLAKTLLSLDIKSVSQTAIDSAEEIGKEAVKTGFKLTVNHQLIKLKK